MGLGKFLKQIWQSGLERGLPQKRQTERSYVLLGGRGPTNFGAWAVDPSGITASSIIYSVGVGDDISFDSALIEKFSAKVYALDPTPEAHLWLSQQKVPAGFQFVPYGLADYDGTAQFFPHRNWDWVAHSMVQGVHSSPKTIALPVKRLSTVMKSLGHSSIDLLKMDIEGGEYKVLRDIVDSRIVIKQLLVEFHHRLDPFTPRMTQEIIALLNRAGFKIFFMSPSKEEYSFVFTG